MQDMADFFVTIGKTVSNAVAKQCKFHNDTEYKVLVIDHDGNRPLNPGRIQGNWLFPGFSVDLEMEFSQNQKRRVNFPANKFDNLTHRMSKVFEDHIHQYESGQTAHNVGTYIQWCSIYNGVLLVEA